MTIPDPISALVDEQLTHPRYPTTYPKCPRCRLGWHGLPKDGCEGYAAPTTPKPKPATADPATITLTNLAIQPVLGTSRHWWRNWLTVLRTIRHDTLSADDLDELNAAIDAAEVAADEEAG